MTLARRSLPTYQADQRPAAGTPINWDSQQAQSLSYVVPFWEGSGLGADELVRGVPALSVDLAGDPEFVWGSSSIGVGFHRRANSLSGALAVQSPLIPMPFTATAAIRPTNTTTPNPIISHETSASASRGWVMLLRLQSGTNRLSLNLAAVANYESATCIIPVDHLCYVALSTTGNGGTVRFSAYDTVTGQLMLDGPTAIGTMSISPQVPNQINFGGSLHLTAGGPLYVADCRVYSKAMSEQELVDLVTPSTRWTLFSPGTFTKGSVQATVTMDAPPLVFLELDDLPLGNIQLGMPAPPMAFLELDTPPPSAQAIQPFGGIHGTIVSPGGSRGAIAGD